MREYNSQLEARNSERITAEAIFPGQPRLIALLKVVQERWLRGLRPELRGN